MTHHRPAARLAWRARLPLAAAAGAFGLAGLVGLALPLTASARPVVQGATPLTILGPSQALSPEADFTRCPSAEGFAGTAGQAALRQLARKTPDGLGFFLGSTVEPQALVLCDPDQAAARTVLGPLAGEVASPNQDGAWVGTRTLTFEPADGKPAGLRPGDRITLPAVGPRAALDLAVAAGRGVRTARVPAGAAPARIEVGGTDAAPAVKVTRTDGTAWEWAPAAVGAPRLTAKVTVAATRRATVRGTAAPGALIAVVAEASEQFELAVASAKGRYSVRLRLKRASDAIQVFATDRVARTDLALRCDQRWDQATRRHRSKACRDRDPQEREVIGGASAGSEAALATRAGAGRPVARAAAATSTAPVTQTTVFSTRGNSMAEPVGADVNGDRRPDFALGDVGKRNVLLVSQGSGWKRVKLRREPSSELVVVPDLTGDGRGELLADDGALVTDAFSGPAPPTSIDLRSRRAKRRTDLPLPQLTSFSLTSASLLALSTPVGGLTDATGDGRPELLWDEGLPVVMPSESAPFGLGMTSATIAPVSSFGDIIGWLAENDGDAIQVGDEASNWEEARGALSTLAIGGRLTAVEPVDARRSPAEVQPMEIREYDARGTVSAVRRFQAAGVPQLLDADPATGDVLVRLLTPKACPFERQSDSLRRPKACKEHVLRIDGSGRVQADVTVPRYSDDAVPQAAFAADGDDADARLEVILAFGSGLNPVSPVLLGSERLGATGASRLPELTADGASLEASSGIASTVLPDGSRWVSTTLFPIWSPPAKEPPTRTVLLQPR